MSWWGCFGRTCRWSAWFGRPTRSRPTSTAVADGGFDADGLGRDFAAGYTIVLESVQRYVRALAALLHSIEVELELRGSGERLHHPARISRLRLPLRRSRRADPADPRIEDLAHLRRRRRRAAPDEPSRSRRRVVAPASHRCASGNRRPALPAARAGARGRGDLGRIGSPDARSASAHAADARHPRAECTELLRRPRSHPIAPAIPRRSRGQSRCECPRARHRRRSRRAEHHRCWVLVRWKTTSSSVGRARLSGRRCPMPSRSTVRVAW